MPPLRSQFCVDDGQRREDVCPVPDLEAARYDSTMFETFVPVTNDLVLAEVHVVRSTAVLGNLCNDPDQPKNHHPAGGSLENFLR